MKRQLAMTKLTTHREIEIGGLHGKEVLSCTSQHGETVLHGRVFSDIDYCTERVFVSRGTYVPVLAIDDEPITVGFGEVRIRVTPGWHLITVQIQNRIDTSVKSFPIYVEEGESACFDYVGSPQGWKNEFTSFDSGCNIGNLGHRGITRTDRIKSDSIKLSLGSIVLIGFAGPCFFFPFLATVMLPAEINNLALEFLLASVFLLLGIAGVRWLVRGYLRMMKEDNEEIDATKELGREMGKHDPVPWKASHRSASRIFCLGQGEECEVDPVSGKAAIILDLDLKQGQKKNPGEIELADNKDIPKQTQVYCHAPRVYLDGELLPYGWTRWWVELDPGRHVLRIDLVDESGRHSAERGTSVAREEVVELAEGNVRKVTIEANVEYEFNNGVVNARWFKLIATAEYLGRTENLSTVVS